MPEQTMNTLLLKILSGWGEIKVDELSLNKLGDLNPDAVKLMDRVGWQ